MSNNLYLFTDFFPYTLNEEAFLETEIQYLAKAFGHISILSTKSDKHIRSVPQNVTIYALDQLPNDKTNMFFAFIKFIQLLAYSLIFEPKRVKQIIKIRSLFYHFRAELEKSKVILNLFDFKKGDVLYTYWFHSWLLSLVLLPKTVKKGTKIISRAHRWDLYDEEAGLLEFIPFRNLKVKNIDSVFCISAEGQRYMQKKISNTLRKKIKLSYLGVSPSQSINPEGDGNQIHFVSCSRVVGFKQVELIYHVLCQLTDFKMQWTHFGDGALFKQLQHAVKEAPQHLTVHLEGAVKNQEVLDYYTKNHVDYFISMSRSEGLPVSIMEAIAHGIPVIAVGVNGVPEIVNHKTGILLDVNASVDEISDKIHNFIKNNNINRNRIVDFYNQYFNSESNYTSFSNEIAQL